MRRHSLLLLAACWLTALASLPGRASDPKADEQRLKAVSLKTGNADLLAFVRSRTLSDDERLKVEVLINQLGAVAFRTREKASADLVQKGPVVMELLRQGTNDPDPEIARRCEMCLQKIKDKDVPADVPGAVIRLLATRKVPGAVDALLSYLPFVDNDMTADEVRTALAQLALEGGKADKVLVAALSDKLPLRRGAAAEALIHGGDTEHRAAIKALLEDKDADVRWRTAMALVLAKEKDAVPALINTLVSSTQSQAWQIEDVLVRLAEDKSPPPVALGVDEAGRKKCRDAWLAWWAVHAGNVNLAVLQEKDRLLGYTTMVLLDLGQIIEVDGKDQVRWKIEKLDFPLDIQILSGDRILIAEYHGSRVTERNFQGEVLWQRAFDGPQMAQRLPNGNTFMAGKYQMLEVDKSGKTVFNYIVQGGEGIMKCMKVPSTNEVVCLFEDGDVVRFSADRKELSRFHVNIGIRLFGGRIHALANGNVLIPHHAENLVIEYDAKGKKVWEVRVDQPIAAMRLPNGNTIVTSMNLNRAIEFDRDGNDVWRYQATTRVTRAIRR